MRIVKAIILIPLCAIIAWDVFVFVAANQQPPWLWIVRRPHYEIRFSIELPDGIHTASGVVGAVYFADPWWDDTIPAMPDIGGRLNRPIGQYLTGKAVTMCLSGGAAISMVLEHPLVYPEENYRGPGLVYNDLYSIADELLTQSHPAAFAKYKNFRSKLTPKITAFSVGSISGNYPIPDDLLPPMVALRSSEDVHSAVLFDPKNPPDWLGPGVKFLGATLSVTNAAVRSDADTCLSWLKQYEWALADSAHRRFPEGPNQSDPIARQTHSRNIGPGWGGYFIYRSPI